MPPRAALTTRARAQAHEHDCALSLRVERVTIDNPEWQRGAVRRPCSCFVRVEDTQRKCQQQTTTSGGVLSFVGGDELELPLGSSGAELVIEVWAHFSLRRARACLGGARVPLGWASAAAHAQSGAAVPMTQTVEFASIGRNQRTMSIAEDSDDDDPGLPPVGDLADMLDVDELNQLAALTAPSAKAQDAAAAACAVPTARVTVEMSCCVAAAQRFIVTEASDARAELLEAATREIPREEPMEDPVALDPCARRVLDALAGADAGVETADDARRALAALVTNGDGLPPSTLIVSEALLASARQSADATRLMVVEVCGLAIRGPAVAMSKSMQCEVEVNSDARDAFASLARTEARRRESEWAARGTTAQRSTTDHDHGRACVWSERLVLPLAGHGVNEHLRIRVLAPRHRLSSERTLHTAVLPLQSLSLDRPTDLTLHASELGTPIDPIAQESGHAVSPAARRRSAEVTSTTDVFQSRGRTGSLSTKNSPRRTRSLEPRRAKHAERGATLSLRAQLRAAMPHSSAWPLARSSGIATDVPTKLTHALFADDALHLICASASASPALVRSIEYSDSLRATCVRGPHDAAVQLHIRFVLGDRLDDGMLVLAPGCPAHTLEKLVARRKRAAPARAASARIVARTRARTLERDIPTLIAATVLDGSIVRRALVAARRDHHAMTTRREPSELDATLGVLGLLEMYWAALVDALVVAAEPPAPDARVWSAVLCDLNGRANTHRKRLEAMIASASLDGEHTSSLTASARVLQSLADDLAAVIIGAAANVDGGGDEAVAGQAFVEHATVLARGAFLRGGDILHPSNSLKDTKADAPAGWMQGESGGGARTIAHAPLARVLELVRVLNQHDRIVSDTLAEFGLRAVPATSWRWQSRSRARTSAAKAPLTPALPLLREIVGTDRIISKCTIRVHSELTARVQNAIEHAFTPVFIAPSGDIAPLDERIDAAHCRPAPGTTNLAWHSSLPEDVMKPALLYLTAASSVLTASADDDYFYAHFVHAVLAAIALFARLCEAEIELTAAMWHAASKRFGEDLSTDSARRAGQHAMRQRRFTEVCRNAPSHLSARASVAIVVEGLARAGHAVEKFASHAIGRPGKTLSDDAIQQLIASLGGDVEDVERRVGLWACSLMSDASRCLERHIPTTLGPVSVRALERLEAAANPDAFDASRIAAVCETEGACYGAGKRGALLLAKLVTSDVTHAAHDIFRLRTQADSTDRTTSAEDLAASALRPLADISQWLDESARTTFWPTLVGAVCERTALGYLAALVTAYPHHSLGPPEVALIASDAAALIAALRAELGVRLSKRGADHLLFAVRTLVSPLDALHETLTAGLESLACASHGRNRRYVGRLFEVLLRMRSDTRHVHAVGDDAEAASILQRATQLAQNRPGDDNHEGAGVDCLALVFAPIEDASSIPAAFRNARSLLADLQQTAGSEEPAIPAGRVVDLCPLEASSSTHHSIDISVVAAADLNSPTHEATVGGVQLVHAPTATYVLLCLGHRWRARTPACMQTTSRPTWLLRKRNGAVRAAGLRRGSSIGDGFSDTDMAQFSFPVDELFNAVLRCEIRGIGHRHIGSTTIPLAAFEPGTHVDDWFELSGGGRLRLMVCVNRREPERPVAEAAGAPDAGREDRLGKLKAMIADLDGVTGEEAAELVTAIQGRRA